FDSQPCSLSNCSYELGLRVAPVIGSALIDPKRGSEAPGTHERCRYIRSDTAGLIVGASAVEPFVGIYIIDPHQVAPLDDGPGQRREGFQRMGTAITGCVGILAVFIIYSRHLGIAIDFAEKTALNVKVLAKQAEHAVEQRLSIRAAADRFSDLEKEFTIDLFPLSFRDVLNDG